MFLALPMGLGVHDDLVFGIHGGQPGVALDDATAGLHLGGVVVSDVALHDTTANPLTHFMFIQELFDLAAGALRLLALLLFALAHVFIQVLLIRPSASQTISTCKKSWAISSAELEIKSAMVV